MQLHCSSSYDTKGHYGHSILGQGDFHLKDELSAPGRGSDLAATSEVTAIVLLLPVVF